MSGFFCYTEVLLSSIIDRKAAEANQEGGSVMRSTLQKFDGRAQDYAVGRPVYAEAFVEALFRDYGFSGDAVVADIGSGTGKFAGQLLERGCTVYGVEPNDDMREKAVEELSGFDQFYPVKGTEAGTIVFFSKTFLKLSSSSSSLKTTLLIYPTFSFLASYFFNFFKLKFHCNDLSHVE